MDFKRYSKEEALEGIRSLVQRFAKDEGYYKSGDYKEANTRNEFIDKLFRYLNWDVDHEKPVAPEYREVILEDNIKVDGKSKAPDYTFCLPGGKRMFFVEAKRPMVNIKEDIDPSYQLRRYAYTSGLTVSILTDFEEFAVYDTTIKPRPVDKASVARIRFLKYDQYEEQFDYLWDTFSYDAVIGGSLLPRNAGSRKGTGEIDSELLDTIEQWRVSLAKNIALRNKDISLRNLNIAVQRIIDRIIFLRIAEDKDIEEYGNLRFACVKDAYRNLKDVFIAADKKYNSGLFARNTWIDRLVIDDKVLKDIVTELYYPQCPYAWEVLPVEILGNIYERFLGSEIQFRQVKDGHTAVVEQKPEIKKAGGVYYTPSYIVQYIVEQTVGGLLKGLTPDKVATMTLCDPSCGSGSFLVGAYRYLLSWYLGQYTRTKKARTAALKQHKLKETSKGVCLSLVEKQRILTTHIFGVDIDEQAVEVTKLSLYLQMLEGEGRRDGVLLREADITMLPKMDDNIKCGNSLVGSDFYDGRDMSRYSDEQMHRLNAFDWSAAFPDIFARGGFDCVIGNPPYFNIQTRKTPKFHNPNPKHSRNSFDGIRQNIE